MPNLNFLLKLIILLLSKKLHQIYKLRYKYSQSKYILKQKSLKAKNCSLQKLNQFSWNYLTFSSYCLMYKSFRAILKFIVIIKYIYRIGREKGWQEIFLFLKIPLFVFPNFSIYFEYFNKFESKFTKQGIQIYLQIIKQTIIFLKIILSNTNLFFLLYNFQQQN
ncbi:transmembrane protein, putative (macronuclear) [Tetrahymena thermophila SB210]|uniref:Transmembrane protein, putative n=1 Tax=Tetrahymena thermophila (strain SB210) TaxID=312017 RepID=W7XBB2_TETTS|nr:transmembrane protein, putative [Tetrahymena thermophila SB210]EWS76665.1 transmembrane protein, putative [Tetrahymena thermophila SB210]|eukprot:XP_012650833.1 transmembrane protein, putative [Tetrahymena thermophila SB210]